MDNREFLRISNIMASTDSDIASSFSDSEERNRYNSMAGLATAFAMEELRHTEARLHSEMEALKKKRKSKGVWLSEEGPLCIEDLEDSHLASLPRFLIRENRVSSIEEIPKFILEEIKERGFEIEETGYVDMKIFSLADFDL